jgi:hypothetical protein
VPKKLKTKTVERCGPMPSTTNDVLEAEHAAPEETAQVEPAHIAEEMDPQMLMNPLSTMHHLLIRSPMKQTMLKIKYHDPSYISTTPIEEKLPLV